MSPDREVYVRNAVAGDAERIVELLSLGSLERGRESPADVADYVDALTEIQHLPGCAVLVAQPGAGDSDRDAPVIGVCQLIVFRHLQHRGGRCAEIESMHVHPDWRSQGVGAQLLAEAERRASALGCYRIQLTSNAVRTDAHRFYERNGYRQTHLGFKRLLIEENTEDGQPSSSEPSFREPRSKEK